MAKIYVSPPGTLNMLDRQIWELYETSPRNTKSREMQMLLQGGIVLKNMGILDACIALGLTEGLMPNSEGDSQAAMQAVIARIAEGGDIGRQLPTLATSTEKASSTGQGACVEKSEAISEIPKSPAKVIRPEAEKRKDETQIVDQHDNSDRSNKINREGGLNGMMNLGGSNQ